jgi:cytochrome bd-type quinol oxidase subunit 2
MRAFLGSNFFIIGLLATGGATIYPVMLLSTIAPEYSLKAQQVASTPDTLMSAVCWWPVAFVMTISYFLFISTRYSGKVSVRRDNESYY